METIDLTKSLIKSNDKTTIDKTTNDKKLTDTYANNLIDSNFDFLEAINKATINDNLLSLSLQNVNELKFKLDWKIKNQLVQILNDYIECLYIGNTIDSKNFIEKKNHFIKILTNLPLKLDQNLKNQIKSNDYKLTIIIDAKLKSEIIDLLVKNQIFAIDHRKQIDQKIIKELIQENKDLINKLNNLQVDFSDNLLDRKRKFDDDETESEDDSDVVSKLVNNHENCLNNLKREISDLKKQLDEYKSKTFNCILKDVTEFLSDSSFLSKSFKYLDLDWKIRINSYINEEDNNRYLNFYLRCINSLDDKKNVKWQLDVDYELRIKSNIPNKSDKICKFYNTFKKDNDYGSDKFILIDDLFNLNNGFIKNNSINLEVYLKGDRVIRDI